jgi:CyaY protein
MDAMTPSLIEKITDSEFKSFASQALDRIETKLEHLFETSDFDVDINRQGGVLEIKFPNKTVIVVNLQTPLHELWVAAKEGGFHFRWVGPKDQPQWQDTKTGEDFFKAISRYISSQGEVSFLVEPKV